MTDLLHEMQGNVRGLNTVVEENGTVKKAGIQSGKQVARRPYLGKGPEFEKPWRYVRWLGETRRGRSPPGNR